MQMSEFNSGIALVLPTAMANTKATAGPSPIIFLYDNSDLDGHVTNCIGLVLHFDVIVLTRCCINLKGFLCKML